MARPPIFRARKPEYFLVLIYKNIGINVRVNTRKGFLVRLTFIHHGIGTNLSSHRRDVGRLLRAPMGS